MLKKTPVTIAEKVKSIESLQDNNKLSKRIKIKKVIKKTY